MIRQLIAERGRSHEFDDQVDAPHDEDQLGDPACRDD